MAISKDEAQAIIRKSRDAITRMQGELARMSAACETMRTQMAYMSNLLAADQFEPALEVHRDEENVLPGMG